MNHTWRLPDRELTIGRRPLIMGIINVTPDSFSDGGMWFDHDAALAHGLKLVAQGADILDVGGESTRPGAIPVPMDEELRRVLPLIHGLAHATKIPISIDTSKSQVDRQALTADASIINDVTDLTGDPAMPAFAAAWRAGLVVMHMQGTPQTMQIAPHYDDVVSDIGSYLKERLAALAAVGIDPARVALDPGVGFGKKLDHNLELLA